MREAGRERERVECGVKLQTGGISMDDQCRIMPKVTSWEGISVDAPDILPVASSLGNASSLSTVMPLLLVSSSLLSLFSLFLHPCCTVRERRVVLPYRGNIRSLIPY